jgi:hypothetical protein
MGCVWQAWFTFSTASGICDLLLRHNGGESADGDADRGATSSSEQSSLMLLGRLSSRHDCGTSLLVPALGSLALLALPVEVGICSCSAATLVEDVLTSWWAR